MRLFSCVERCSQNCALPSDFGTRELFVSVAPEPISPTCPHGTNMRRGNLIVLSPFQCQIFLLYIHPLSYVSGLFSLVLLNNFDFFFTLFNYSGSTLCENLIFYFLPVLHNNTIFTLLLCLYVFKSQTSV